MINCGLLYTPYNIIYVGYNCTNWVLYLLESQQYLPLFLPRKQELKRVYADKKVETAREVFSLEY